MMTTAIVATTATRVATTPATIRPRPFRASIAAARSNANSTRPEPRTGSLVWARSRCRQAGAHRRQERRGLPDAEVEPPSNSTVVPSDHMAGAKLLAGDEFAVPRDEERQHLKGLPRKFHRPAVTPQFPVVEPELEWPERHLGFARRGWTVADYSLAAPLDEAAHRPHVDCRRISSPPARVSTIIAADLRGGVCDACYVSVQPVLLR